MHPNSAQQFYLYSSLCTLLFSKSSVRGAKFLHRMLGLAGYDDCKHFSAGRLVSCYSWHCYVSHEALHHIQSLTEFSAWSGSIDVCFPPKGFVPDHYLLFSKLIMKHCFSFLRTSLQTYFQTFSVKVSQLFFESFHQNYLVRLCHLGISGCGVIRRLS